MIIQSVQCFNDFKYAWLYNMSGLCLEILISICQLLLYHQLTRCIYKELLVSAEAGVCMQDGKFIMVCC